MLHSVHRSPQITGHKSRSIHMIPSVIFRHSIQQTFVFPIPPNFHAPEQWAGHYQPIDQVLCISSTRNIQPWATSHNELSKHLKLLKASSPPVSNFSSPSCTTYKKLHINVLDLRYPTTWWLILVLWSNSSSLHVAQPRLFNSLHDRIRILPPMITQFLMILPSTTTYDSSLLYVKTG